MMIDSAVLHSKLKEFFGFSSFKGEQEAIIKNLISGNDSFVLMPTGGGKSLCYQLPALVMEGTAIVISPLIALMKNQVDAIRGFVTGDEGIAHFLNSSLNKAQMVQVKEDVENGVTKILYVAPESLTKDDNVDFLQKIKISFYAIDEAHCISEWGHDFRPEYRNIRTLVNKIGRAPIIALTATATPKVQSDILKNLGIQDAVIFRSSFNRPNLYYEVRDKVEPEKDIVKFIRQNPGKSGIIYCLSRKKVEELSALLNINGIAAVPYHAGLEAKVRAENQDKFLMGDVNVIVATIAFGMGIDKPDVRFVIHYDIPKSLEGYYQETGRAGRDGLEGRCIAYYRYKDVEKLEKFMQGKPVSEQEIGNQLIGETVAYAESGDCRRKILLNYFGEKYPLDNCGNCDNCLHPRPHFDGRKDLVIVLELVKSLPEHFKTGHLAGILAGEDNAMIKSYKHDKLSFFGLGKKHDIRYWSMVIRHALIIGLLHKDIESYGLISITQEGEKYIEAPYEVMLVEPRQFSEGTDEEEEESAPAVKAGAGDETLMAMLKDLRKDMAKKLKVQPWVIFTDPSLSDMSTLYPETTEELQSCQGVGEGKAVKYGKPFLDLIKKYVEENEITRPEDVRFKIRRQSSKEEVIKYIDRRMDLDLIAGALDIDMDELLTKMEKIVSFGTKLNLNYYIKENIDPDVVEEIYDWFRNKATSDSLDEALKALGGEYEEMEIRLVRLKFLCEVTI